MGEDYLLPVDDVRFPPYMRLFRKEIHEFLESKPHFFNEYISFLYKVTGDEWYLPFARSVLEDPVLKMRELSKKEGKFKDMGVEIRVRTDEDAQRKAEEIEKLVQEEAVRMKERVISTLVWDITHNKDSIHKLDRHLKKHRFDLYQDIHLAGLDADRPGVKIFFERFYREDNVNLLDSVAASFGGLGFLPKLTQAHDCFAYFPIPEPDVDAREKNRQFLRNLPRLEVEDDEWFYTFLECIDNNKGDPSNDNVGMLHFLCPNYEEILDERDSLRRLRRDKERNLHRRTEEVVADEDLRVMRRQRDYADFGIPPNYGHTNKVLQLRDYQEELVQHAVAGKNTLVVAPTGAGKTEVCIFAAMKHFEQREAEGKPSRVVMLVPKVPLVNQQEERFRQFFSATKSTCGFHGDITIRGHSRQKVFLGSEIIVMTAEILLNMLRTVRAAERLYLADITLLIFDEMHHCNKEHVYKKIMDFIMAYPYPECRPQILGLTATPLPVATTNLESSLEAIYKLMASANCYTLSTVVRNVASLENYVPKPDEEFYKVNPATITPNGFASAASMLIAKIRNLIDKDIKELSKPAPTPYLKQHELLPSYRTPGPFLARVNQFRVVLSRLTNPLKHKPLAACDFFISLGTALAMDELMPSTYAYEFVKEDLKRVGERHPSNLVEDIRNQVKDYMEYLEEGASAPEDKPILKSLIKCLKMNFREKPDSKCIIFVAERSTARNLCDFLNRQGVLKNKKYNPEGVQRDKVLDFGFITSTKTGTGQTIQEQMETLKKFEMNIKDGGLKCVVSTSVLDEGIDVAKCNLIIKYNTSSSAVSKIQRAGRARAWNSKSILFCLHEGIAESEYSAILTGNMMKKCVAKMMEIGEVNVRKEILEYVRKKEREAEVEKAAAAGVLHSLQGREYEVVCRLGNHYICNSDSIRYEGSHYVVVDPLVWDRLMIKITSKKKAVDSETLMLGEVLCVGDNRIEDLSDYTTSKPSQQACGCIVGKIMKIAGAFVPHLKAGEIMLREVTKLSEDDAPVIGCKNWKNIAGVNFYVPPLADHDIKRMLNALNDSRSQVQEEMMIKLELCVEKMSGDAAREADRRRQERERRERIKNRPKDDFTDLAVDLDKEKEREDDAREYQAAEENKGFSYKDSDNEEQKEDWDEY